MIISKTFRSQKLLTLARATELAAPALRLAARGLSGPPTSPQTWKKGLLLGANHIGDLLYRSSSLSQLAHGLPQCQWDIVAPEPAAQILEGNPAIRQIHRFELPTSTESEEFQTLQREHYDAALCYDSGSYTHPLLTALKLRIPNRVGYIHKGWSGLVTHPISIRYPQPYPAYFRDLVGDLTHLEPDSDLRPLVSLTAEDETEAEVFYQEVMGSETSPLMACFVTTRQPTGVWPVEKFRETLELLHASTPVHIVLCGAPSDVDKLARLQSSLSFPCSLNAGGLNLKALVAFLKKCRVVLSTDSGPRHLANAAGVPVVYLRNLHFSKIEAGNYLDSEYDMAPDVEFVQPEEQDGVIDKINPTSIADQILPFLLK